MLYVDYLIEMNEDGLMFTDKDSPLEPNHQLTMDKVPFEEGDVFTLIELPDGRLLFKRTSRPSQMELQFD